MLDHMLKGRFIMGISPGALTSDSLAFCKTLLRETVRELLKGHKVFLTDWTDARLVPVSAGRFDLDETLRADPNLYPSADAQKRLHLPKALDQKATAALVGDPQVAADDGLHAGLLGGH